MSSRSRMVIGVTEPSLFTKHCIYTIENFFGANPIKLCQNKPEDLKQWLDLCDAVILAGGTDIHPRTYAHSVMNDHCFAKFDVRRDRREIRIIDYCIEKDIPLFGICRGHQMLGIYHGLPFIPDLTGSTICHQPTAQKISHEQEEPMHWVRLLRQAVPDFSCNPDPEEIFAHPQASDEHHLWVNSFHHQGLMWVEDERRVDVLGYCLAHGKEQKNIELMRSSDEARWLSCQWHPEYDWEQNPASRMVLSQFKKLITSRSKKKRSRVQVASRSSRSKPGKGS